MFLNPIKKEFQFGQHTVVLTTGLIARQATGSVLVEVDGTSVLVTAVGRTTAKEDRGFFPLTVNYQERAYAGGKFPGGFFKREGRPHERETLIARLIDRPIRPLFPKGFKNEVQVIATVASMNPEVNPDVPAMIGASAALALSGIPFDGPIGGVRVGYRDDAFLLNPSPEDLKTSELDLVVAGTKEAVLMVESEAKLLPEDVMLEAVWFGHEQMQVAIDAISELAAEAGKPAWEFVAPPADEALVQTIKDKAETELLAAYQMPDKTMRYTQLDTIRTNLIEALCGEGEEQPSQAVVKGYLEKLEKRIVRDRILEGYPRIDGRDTRTVRPLDIRVGVLPRVHGSALFTRGETQALVSTTLGSERDSQILDDLMGERRDRFLLHYNFPPYCVGETGMMLSPKRREIGHGKLAKRGVTAILPSEEEFSYVIRVVSEITESNGSSSMASICGASLALMDAGVPVKAPVAGIAMGLIKEENKFAILTDILGDEDHLGDMDFKVAGTENGITALQMDIKIQGITKFIMEKALEQAREGRLHILQQMNAVIDVSRTELSPFAPVIRCMKINPEKIRDVIGKGGATIRSITEETGVTIDINDDGQVKIAAVDQAAGDAAWERIRQIVADVEVGQIYEGRVNKIMDFGAFVNILPGKDGLLHISEIKDARVNDVRDELTENQMVTVKVIGVDQRAGRIRLSMKALKAE